MNSIVIKNPGSTRSQTLTLNVCTHQLLKVVCSDTKNGKNEAISPINTARLQRCFPAPPWHQCVFLKTVFVGTFLHIRRQHLTRVTNNASILEQTPNLSFPAEILGCCHVERNGISVPPAKPSNPRNLHSPKEHAEGIPDADEVQSSHSTIHISWYTWSLILTEYCLLEGWDQTTRTKACLDPFVFPPILTIPSFLVSFESPTRQL